MPALAADHYVDGAIEDSPISGKIRGGLYVVAEIEMPKTVTREQRELWEQLAELEK